MPLALAALVMGCDMQDRPDEVARSTSMPEGVDYRGIETQLLDGDLVQFMVGMGPEAEPQHVELYAECAAAQYALIRGYGFARHVRTNIDKENDGWRGDAIYTISSSLPRGLKTIDAEVVADNCAENGIPMV
ncbi:MAG: hypothetical protein HLUCCO07_00830 [Rhodobacteraceae bacterium HLUCCO07]|nr:MAG: hypothetical protein HLUCCO07_00830 [Rhodobacteraceae bacterium HLUCCO07]